MGLPLCVKYEESRVRHIHIDRGAMEVPDIGDFRGELQQTDRIHALTLRLSQ